MSPSSFIGRKSAIFRSDRINFCLGCVFISSFSLHLLLCVPIAAEAVQNQNLACEVYKQDTNRVALKKLRKIAQHGHIISLGGCKRGCGKTKRRLPHRNKLGKKQPNSQTQLALGQTPSTYF